MATLYRIRDWDRHFENDRSRGVKKCSYVLVPNKHDGEGYQLIMRHKRAGDIFACFILAIQVASKCVPRGDLVRGDGTPMDAKAICLKTSWRDVDAMQMALDFVSSPEIGWIQCVTTDGEQDVTATGVGRECDVSKSRPTPDGTEKNRTEPKGSGDDGKPEAGKDDAPAPDSEAVKLANELADSILTWKPDFAPIADHRRSDTLRKWARDIDKLLRIDKRDHARVRKLIAWLPSHSGNQGFRWRVNILSGNKLRMKFDRLEMDMAAGNPGEALRQKQKAQRVNFEQARDDLAWTLRQAGPAGWADALKVARDKYRDNPGVVDAAIKLERDTRGNAQGGAT